MSEPVVAPAPLTRRERLRQELTAEIKATALRQLEEGGPAAVSLRGIARELSVSPAALYGYVDDLDDLFTALITDGFNALAEAVEGAIAARAGEPAADRVLAGLFAYRRWAIDHKPLFRLLYFSPVPGYVAPEDGPTLAANLRVCAAFLAVLVEAWRAGELEPPEPGMPLDCSKFVELFGIDITPDQLRASIGCWGEFHGLVTLEVNDHVSAAWVDPGELYAAEMRSMLRSFGFADPSPAITP